VERRSSARTEIVAVVECQAGPKSDRTIAYDLSPNGCLLQCANGFVETGDLIEMSWPGAVTTRGRVAWVKDLNAGVQFSEHWPALTLIERVRDQPISLPIERPSGMPPVGAHRSRLIPQRPFDPPTGVKRRLR
jgi:hypothetical protein